MRGVAGAERPVPGGGPPPPGARADAEDAARRQRGGAAELRQRLPGARVAAAPGGGPGLRAGQRSGHRRALLHGRVDRRTAVGRGGRHGRTLPAVPAVRGRLLHPRALPRPRAAAPGSQAGQPAGGGRAGRAAGQGPGLRPGPGAAAAGRSRRHPDLHGARGAGGARVRPACRPVLPGREPAAPGAAARRAGPDHRGGRARRLATAPGDRGPAVDRAGPGRPLRVGSRRSAIPGAGRGPARALPARAAGGGEPVRRP